MKLLVYLRALLLIPFLIGFIFVCSLVALLVLFSTGQSTFEKLIFGWAYVMIKVSGVDVRVKGRGRLRASGASIVVSNHNSHFDIPILFYALRVPLRMVAKKELFRIPFFGWALKRGGFVCLDRASSTQAIQALGNSSSLLKNGQYVWIAPEGTRSKTGHMGEFKMGAFALAVQTKTRVIPVLIHGSSKILPKGSLFTNLSGWKTRVDVEILDPVATSSWNWEDRKKLRDLVRERLLRAQSLKSSIGT
ncbi:MAG: 1-acyl-sn-glycerol-3-phosphate acyltransferase [Oligoflexia bacterium]|nr:1-acyl-sn-glycerol-3-phosphate acyltransferase [Oligoflexia bacterium]